MLFRNPLFFSHFQRISCDARKSMLDQITINQFQTRKIAARNNYGFSIKRCLLVIVEKIIKLNFN